jgi:hypothetical protein
MIRLPESQRPIEMFAELGKPGNEGNAFAITRHALVDIGDDVSKWPRPDYEHAIFLDPHSGNYLIERGGRPGGYWCERGAMKRVR